MIVFFVVVIFLFDEITLWPIRCAAKMVVAKICSKDVYGKDAYRKKCLKQIYIYTIEYYSAFRKEKISQT